MDADSVKSLEDAYQYLEEHVMSDGLVFHPFLKSGQVLNNLYNQRKEDGADPNELSKIHCECTVFMAGYPENPAKGDLFKEIDYDYLKKRVEGAVHPLLKSRYAHLLLHCNIPDKFIYAKIAVQEYLKLVKIYEEKPDGISGTWSTALEWSMKNALILSAQFGIHECQNQVKAEVKRLIFQRVDKEPQYSFLIVTLIKQMLDQKRMFKKDDFVGIDEICISHALVLRKGGKNFPHKAIELYELGQKVERKIGTQKHDWDLYIAETHEELCQAFENNPSVALEECQEALVYYRRLKQSIKIKEMEQKIQELKKKVVIPMHKIEIQDKEYQRQREAYDELVEKLTEGNPEDILKYLSYSSDLILDYDTLMKGASSYLENSVSQKLLNTVLFDQFGNRAQVFETEDEKKALAKNKVYRHLLDNYLYYLLHRIIIESVRKGILTPQIVSNFFQDNSWYGKEFAKYSLTGNTIAFRWLDLIMPAIGAYLSSLKSAIESEERPNLILPLDSLTIKFEGIFRDFCAFNGISPTLQKTGQNKILEQEKNLNNLLYDDYDEVITIFGKSETEFFRFLFVEKYGHNLRNSVAHSLLFEHQYSIYYMNLVFLAILRLSRGNFREEEQGEEDGSGGVEEPDDLRNDSDEQ